MLIQFEIDNYACFAERVQLSMVSSADKSLANNMLPVEVPGATGMHVLKSALLLGPNASGKSTLIRALKFMRHMVLSSAVKHQPGEAIAVEPFLLDAELAEQPSRFELIFVHQGVRYRYGFAATTAHIVEEWLYAAPKRQERLLFERSLADDLEPTQFRFGPSFKGGESTRTQLIKQTRNNALFLSLAAQMNQAEALHVHKWFRSVLRPVITGTDREPFGLGFYTAKESLKNSSLRASVRKLLREADLGVSDFQVDIRPFDTRTLDLMPAELREHMHDAKHMTVELVHGEKSFPLEIESDGTKTLFDLAGPVLTTLQNGGVMFIDELDLSLHTHLTRALLKLIHDANLNHAGQFIFSAHDTNLLDPELFRRDQIWLTEKNSEGRASLTPLSDFKVRKGEALERGYLKGRYGALPFVAGIRTGMASVLKDSKNRKLSS